MNHRKTLLAAVATAMIATGAIAADVPGAADQNPVAGSRNAPATQPGLPDPSNTARMSDVGDGSGQPVDPMATKPQPAKPGVSDSSTGTTSGR